MANDVLMNTKRKRERQGTARTTTVVAIEEM
jgi:hypothetical protein